MKLEGEVDLIKIGCFDYLKTAGFLLPQNVGFSQKAIAQTLLIINCWWILSGGPERSSSHARVSS
jgi:hypothetical protein